MHFHLERVWNNEILSRLNARDSFESVLSTRVLSCLNSKNSLATLPGSERKKKLCMYIRTMLYLQPFPVPGSVQPQASQR